MALSPGDKLGPYEILAKLGEGRGGRIQRRGLVAQNGRHDGDGVLSVEGPPSAGNREALPREAAGAALPDGGRPQARWERRTSPRWAGLMRKLNLRDS
jgi:hypothetical protein